MTDKTHDIVLTADIGRQEVCFRAHLPKFGDEGVSGCGIPPGTDQPRALGCKGKRRRTADAGGRAGNQDNRMRHKRFLG
ncbi:hypothetical protein Rmet_6716 (plasmid) [Cupriavidus metallidurans CH34]|uniref:Uncharacterized protein n=1 Tax=Cupriavidus metallidurans (strain ATCC 43123 / DSM 2839 / NBRC 102507 / CH34) TaxID=266264 RepID=D3DYC6_CUPMC|nr:hypothetical protein Rmet_6716 [Cupriavidus metallidurans CH34]